MSDQKWGNMNLSVPVCFKSRNLTENVFSQLYHNLANQYLIFPENQCHKFYSLVSLFRDSEYLLTIILDTLGCSEKILNARATYIELARAQLESNGM